MGTRSVTKERPQHAFTPREKEVLRVVQFGASTYSDIADRLQPKCSVRTAQGLVKLIFLKLPNAGDQPPLIRVIRWASSQPTFREE